jgi:S1-C subfamily serine protease
LRIEAPNSRRSATRRRYTRADDRRALRFDPAARLASTPALACEDEQLQHMPKSYVLTNEHVVRGARVIDVTTKDGRAFRARLVGYDKATDVAVLQIKPDNLAAVPMGDSTSLDVGDFVLAIGNPFGLGQTVTSGIVYAVGRTGLGIEGYEDFIQTDASRVGDGMSPMTMRANTLPPKTNE